MVATEKKNPVGLVVAVGIGVEVAVEAEAELEVLAGIVGVDNIEFEINQVEVERMQMAAALTFLLNIVEVTIEVAMMGLPISVDDPENKRYEFYYEFAFLTRGLCN